MESDEREERKRLVAEFADALDYFMDNTDAMRESALMECMLKLRARIDATKTPKQERLEVR